MSLQESKQQSIQPYASYRLRKKNATTSQTPLRESQENKLPEMQIPPDLKTFLQPEGGASEPPVRKMTEEGTTNNMRD